MERVLDAFVVTEKAPLVGTDLTQVKGCQRQTPCGWRDQEELPLKEVKENAWQRKRRSRNKALRSSSLSAFTQERTDDDKEDNGAF